MYSSNRQNPSGYTLPYIKRYRNRQSSESNPLNIEDYGPYPFAVNIQDFTKANNTFRTALWTGDHLQLTLMSIPPGEDIGLEIHPHTDQFIRIESGKALVMMGDDPENPNFKQIVGADYAFIIPAGKWHNVINIGQVPLKLYSIYAPANHAFGTVHQTKADAIEQEEH